MFPAAELPANCGAFTRFAWFRAAIVITTLHDGSSITRANTVKPPFWWSRLAELSARLMKNWLVAESGWPANLAIDSVRAMLDRLNSFTTGASVGIAVSAGVLS